MIKIIEELYDAIVKMVQMEKFLPPILIVGGNRKVNDSDQLNSPYHIFIDKDHSVYVSDCYNHRLMKWIKNAKEGILIVGGNEPNQFNSPVDLSFDQQIQL